MSETITQTIMENTTTQKTSLNTSITIASKHAESTLALDSQTHETEHTPTHKHSPELITMDQTYIAITPLHVSPTLKPNTPQEITQKLNALLRTTHALYPTFHLQGLWYRTNHRKAKEILDEIVEIKTLVEKKRLERLGERLKEGNGGV